jgi:hypothetical protein
VHDVSIEERGGEVNSFASLVVLWVLLACVSFASQEFSELRISDHCKDFGKVKIKSEWYECKPMDAVK